MRVKMCRGINGKQCTEFSVSESQLCDRHERMAIENSCYERAAQLLDDQGTCSVYADKIRALKDE